MATHGSNADSERTPCATLEIDRTQGATADVARYDVAIVGAGVAGMACAARLQAQGLATIVLEAHDRPGGCAGYFRERGFSFDVGATTLVDFERGGVGGELLDAIGMPPFECDLQTAYVAWLPDRAVVLHRDGGAWREERRRMLGDEPSLGRFWEHLDRLADVFWSAARAGVKLPLQSPRDLLRALRALSATGVVNLPLVRYLDWTMGDCLRAHGLRDHRALVGLLSMLIEDTVHSSVDEAPLINAALGITLRHAGLMRARGGMHGFWRAFMRHYRSLGGVVRFGCKVESIRGRRGSFTLHTRRGPVHAAQVVSAVPAELSARIAPPDVARALAGHVQHNARRGGGAFVLFLGVPGREIGGQAHTHHQILQDYARPLGDGNNMFISVSAEGDEVSAPLGHRAVMISTHCKLEDWERLTEGEYVERKRSIRELLLRAARRVYPALGEAPVVIDAGTPRTYERFTQRPRGAVGGLRLALDNSNQHAIPHDLGIAGFWLAGDTTWPGLGTVACVLGSRIVAERVSREAARIPRRQRALSKQPRVAVGDAGHAL